MAERRNSLASYSLTDTLAKERPQPDCYVVDVNFQEGDVPNSLAHITELVESFTAHGRDRTTSITKLYIIGEWRPVFVTEEDTDENRNAVPLLQREWEAANGELAKLITRIPTLKQLTWISGLPFMACVWGALNNSLTKLIIDLGVPVRLEQNGETMHKSYITLAEMKQLQEQTQLKELRLFNMHDSYQSIVWATVHSNTTSGGMRLLELNMAAPPDVRVAHWHKAEDVRGLTVPKEDDRDKEYKGIDGKGILHYMFGTGEYLDDLCMRKARIASGLEEAKPLALWCLKLDGFVLDFLPFEHELSRIELLTCGINCFDAGLRAPKIRRVPYNRWSQAVNNARTNCLIQWPNWTGIFDDHGDQRDSQGDVVDQNIGLSTPVDDLPQSPIPAALLNEPLSKKDLDVTSEGKEDKYHHDDLASLHLDTSGALLFGGGIALSDMSSPADGVDCGQFSPANSPVDLITPVSTYSDYATYEEDEDEGLMGMPEANATS